ncbi:hypothetical protein H5410_051814 [Solanum commersonii]|uniref:Uncharacterized protein n=1 Tax=Solanum commersonii TaxID=4109 RepID=A0A9J5WZH5_SOLCO|nr:hypothetical protein H5410_051814 [Solanum commersonii]
MALILNIDRIALDTLDWIYKVQIVEIGRPQKKCHIRAAMYADKIVQYANKLTLMDTYFISTARIKVSPTSYDKTIHTFYWVLDKEAVIEHVKLSDEIEKPLPPPTKLNIIAFDRIAHMIIDSTSEVDTLAMFFVVVLQNMQVEKICFSSLYEMILEK